MPAVLSLLLPVQTSSSTAGHKKHAEACQHKSTVPNYATNPFSGSRVIHTDKLEAASCTSDASKMRCHNQVLLCRLSHSSPSILLLSPLHLLSLPERRRGAALRVPTTHSAPIYADVHERQQNYADVQRTERRTYEFTLKTLLC